MPALPNAPSTIAVKLIGTIGTDLDVVNKHYIQYSGSAPTVTQITALCNSVGAAWNTDIRGLVPSAYTLADVECTDLTSPTSATAIVASGNAGTRTGSELPASSALVMAHVISRRYRGGHPRNYWYWGVQADLANAQQWGSTFLTAALGGWQNYLTAIEAAGWTGAGTITPVNVSYYKGFVSVQNPLTLRWRNIPTPRTTVVLDTITSYVARGAVGSQRRRNQA